MEEKRRRAAAARERALAVRTGKQISEQNVESKNFKEETRNSTEKDESKDFGSKAGGRATSQASTTNDPLQRKKDLAAKLRRLTEERRALATANATGEVASTGNPDDIKGDALEEKKRKRLAEAQRLKERSARAREARLRREAEFESETRRVELKGYISKSTSEDSQSVHSSPSMLAKRRRSRQRPDSTLVPDLVKETERLSLVIRRYETKLETACHSLLDGAKQYKEDEEAESAKDLPLPEMLAFISQREWYQHNSNEQSGQTLPSLAFSKLESADQAKQSPFLGEKANDIFDKEGSGSGAKTYRVSAVGETFLNMDGPVNADVGRFLSFLRHSNEEMTIDFIREHWAEVSRFSGDIQSVRIHERLDELFAFCFENSLIE